MAKIEFSNKGIKMNKNTKSVFDKNELADFESDLIMNED